jgi:hypothetical protein
VPIFLAVKISFQAKSSSKKLSCSAKPRRTSRAGGRFATFRFAAFSRSKTFFRFVGWFSWQPAR